MEKRELEVLTSLVAGLMGSEWKFEATESFYYCQIKHADGRIIQLSSGGGMGGAKGMVHVSGIIPSGRHYLPHDAVIPSINVSEKKTPAQVLRDIQARFIDQYSELYRVAKAGLAAAEELKKSAVALRKELCEIVGAPVRDASFFLSMREGYLTGWVSDTASVKLEISGVSKEVAREVCAVLAKHKEKA